MKVSFTVSIELETASRLDALAAAFEMKTSRFVAKILEDVAAGDDVTLLPIVTRAKHEAKKVKS